jgi:mannose-6-phosphate isomerase-like protein (cupin superfamily)
MSYSKKNLRDVEDSAPKFGFDAVQEARFAQRDLDSGAIGLGLLRVKPGQRQAFAHRHDDAEEIYVVVSGSGRIKLDDELVEIGPLDAIRIDPKVTRAVEAGDEGIEYIAFGPHHPSDGELVEAEEFWGA